MLRVSYMYYTLYTIVLYHVHVCVYLNKCLDEWGHITNLHVHVHGVLFGMTWAVSGASIVIFGSACLKLPPHGKKGRPVRNNPRCNLGVCISKEHSQLFGSSLLFSS